MNQSKLHLFANIAGLFIICAILIAAFSDQFIDHELPCPLCLLQRVCFIASGLCMALNIKQGAKTTHYGLLILTSLLGFSIALRQIFLHVAPGDLGYGAPLLGLHLYTWAAIFFLFIVAFTAIGLFFEKAFNEKAPSHWLGKTVIGLFLALILANSVSALFECGFGVCPDDPKTYELLPHFANS